MAASGLFRSAFDAHFSEPLESLVVADKSNFAMCGRYRLSRRKQIIEEYFDAADWQDDWSPRYNIAPTQLVPVIRHHPKEPVGTISSMRWGLIPNWADDPSIATRTINAKSETVDSSPT